MSDAYCPGSGVAMCLLFDIENDAGLPCGIIESSSTLLQIKKRNSYFSICLTQHARPRSQWPIVLVDAWASTSPLTFFKLESTGAFNKAQPEEKLAGNSFCQTPTKELWRTRAVMETCLMSERQSWNDFVLHSMTSRLAFAIPPRTRSDGPGKPGLRPRIGSQLSIYLIKWSHLNERVFPFLSILIDRSWRILLRHID